MSEKEKTKAEQIVDLVHDWTRLDNPKSMRDAVHKWTGRKSFEEKAPEIPV